MLAKGVDITRVICVGFDGWNIMSGVNTVLIQVLVTKSKSRDE